jgi:hypothetical protein
MAAQLAVAFLALLSSSAFLAVSGQKFNAIFSFGDSMSDTGNLCVNGPPAGLTLTQPPYGETFFGRATCRCSDGRLVVDFLGGYRTLCSHARTHVLTFISNAPIDFPSKKRRFCSARRTTRRDATLRLRRRGRTGRGWHAESSVLLLSLLSRSREVRATAAEAVEAGRLRLQAGRQHGDHWRDHHGLGLLPVAGHRRQDLEQRAPQHPDPVVPGADAVHLRLDAGYVRTWRR